MKITIEIQPGDGDGDVVIQNWVADDSDRDAVNEGVHALLASLGPIPETGWLVRVTPH